MSDMNEIEDMGRRLKKACLSGTVAALEAMVEEDELILDRVSSLPGFFNDTPLHVAALRGHLDFTKALLCRKPRLATELDSLRCSPLHLASSEGHFEVVQELLRVNTDVCTARDQDGRIPLHLAVMKERVLVIQELLGAKPNSIHKKLGRGETVLHLSIKYNKVEALKILVQYLQTNNKDSLLNSRDDDGNTILHLAVALKQMDANHPLSTIMMAMTGFPSTVNKHLTWLMVITVFITIYCMVISYQSAMALVSPNVWSKFYFTILLSVMGFLCLFFMVLQSCRFLVWLWKNLVKLVKACYRCCGPTPRAAHNITTDQESSSWQP